MASHMDVNRSAITLSPQMRLRAAMALAIAADVVQIALFPLFIEGAVSPADDLLDLGVAGALTSLLGWHWEFAPSFLAKLVPGIDFVPLWTMAVANVYRKSKLIENRDQGNVAQGTVIEGEPVRRDAPKS